MLALPNAHIFISTAIFGNFSELEHPIKPIQKTSFVSAVKPAVEAIFNKFASQSINIILGAPVKFTLLLYRVAECAYAHSSDPNFAGWQSCMGPFGLKLIAQTACELGATAAGVPPILSTPGCYIIGREGVQLGIDLYYSTFTPESTGFRFTKDLVVKISETFFVRWFEDPLGFYFAALVDGVLIHESKDIMGLFSNATKSIDIPNTSDVSGSSSLNDNSTYNHIADIAHQDEESVYLPRQSPCTFRMIPNSTPCCGELSSHNSHSE